MVSKVLIESNKIHVGSSLVTGVSVGSTPAKRIYVGSTLVYDRVTYYFEATNYGSTIPPAGGTYTIPINRSDKVLGNGDVVNVGYTPTSFTVAPNTSTSTKSGTVTTTQNTSGLTQTCSWSQAADYVTGYDAPNVSGVSLSCSDIPASGGTISSGALSGNVTQVRRWASGNTDTLTYAVGSTSVSWGTAVTGSNLGTTTTSRTNKGTLTATITVNGKSNTVSSAVYQVANVITAYSELSGTLSLSVGTIPASGGSKSTSDVSATKSCSQTVTYTSGSTRAGSISYSAISGSTVTASSKGTTVSSITTVKSNAFSITATGEGSKTKTAYCDVYQAKNELLSYSYDAPYGIQISCTDIPASGGTVSSGLVVGTCSQTRHYNYDAGSDLYSDTVTGEDSASWSGSASGSNLGETTTSRTSKGTLYYTYTKNSKSTVVSWTVYQMANKLNSYGDLNISSVSISCNDVPASGGSVTSGSASGTIYQNYNWTSGSYSHSFTAGSYVSWSGGASGISSLGTTVKSRSAVGSALVATFTVNGKSAQKSITVYQAENKVESSANSNWSVTVTSATQSIAATAASGISIGCNTASHTKTDTYSSGATNPVSVSDGFSCSTSTDWITVSGTNYSVTANSGAERSGTITIANDHNSSCTTTVTVTQAAGTVSVSWTILGNYTYIVSDTFKVCGQSVTPAFSGSVNVPGSTQARIECSALLPAEQSGHTLTITVYYDDSIKMEQSGIGAGTTFPLDYDYGVKASAASSHILKLKFTQV